MNVIQILEQGRDRIAKGWCQLHEAKDEKGNPCAPDSIQAVRWCAVGAIKNYLWPRASFQAQYLLNQAAGMDIAGYNDSSTQEAVLNVFSFAIERIKQQGKPPQKLEISEKVYA